MKLPVISVFLCLVGGLTGFEPGALLGEVSTAPNRAGIKIVIASGQNGANILSAGSAVQPVVEVLDNSNKPVPGAVVKFSAPKSAPTVKFADGRDTTAVVTDLKGVATVSGMVPVGAGAFRLDLTAEYDDQMASAQVSQTNYRSMNSSGQPVMHDKLSAAGDSHHGLSRGAKAGIVVAIAAAAAAGIAVGLHGGSKKSGTSIGVGTPTVGAP